MLVSLQLSGIVKKFLPQGASILKLQNLQGTEAILSGDMDRDEIPEIAAVYSLQGDIHLMVLKAYDESWERIADTKERGFGVDYMELLDITGNGKEDLVVGWQIGAAWSELCVFSLNKKHLKKIASGITYSMAEAEDMPGNNGTDGKTELALWSHVELDAYRVDVLRWNGEALVQAEDVYSYYFPKVVSYYEEKIRQIPEAAFYWYYLADAQMKAGMPDNALKSIETGIGLNSKYPSKKDFTNLREKIEEAKKGAS